MKRTKRLFLLTPRSRQFLNTLVSYTGLVQSHRVSRLHMQRVDNPAALLGNLLPGLAERARHFGEKFPGLMAIIS